ncbi:MAG: S-layer homology domain-containing protein [Cellulosilyticaceae bacterium]
MYVLGSGIDKSVLSFAYENPNNNGLVSVVAGYCSTVGPFSFSECSTLTSANLLACDTSNVTSMKGLFNSCSALTDVKVSSFDTHNVVDMSYMFCNCQSLKSLDVSSFNTLNVIYMDSLFFNCQSLTELYLQNFTTHWLTNMHKMFQQCYNLQKITLSNIFRFNPESHLPVPSTEFIPESTGKWYSFDDDIAYSVADVHNGVKTVRTYCVFNTPAIITLDKNLSDVVEVVDDNAPTLTVSASSSPNRPLSYQWYFNTTNTYNNALPIPSAITPSYNLPNTLPTGDYFYFCVVSSTGKDSVYSNISTVSIKYSTIDINRNLHKPYHESYMFGYPDNTFKPNQPITRIETIVIFSRLLVDPIDDDETYKSSFLDVKETNWYANILGYMEQFNTIAAHGDKTFHANDGLTRAEFISILSKFTFLETSDISFSDIPLTHWAFPLLSSANAKGWITGYPDNTFKPEQLITRAEAITIINRMLNRHCSLDFIESYIDDNIRLYLDMQSTHWAYNAIFEASNSHIYRM